MYILDNAASVYTRFLRSSLGSAGQEYLLSRGILSTTSNWFRLGMTPNKKMFTKMMVSDKHKYGNTIKELENIGLVYNNTEKFNNSIIFPVLDEFDNVFSLTGRQLGGNGPKYINLSNIPLDLFYGLHQAKHRFKYPTLTGMPINYVLLCEGQIDTITAVQEGYFSLGLLGAHSFKENLLHYLELYDSIIVALDNDQAGEKASKQVCSNLKYYFPDKTIFYVNLPDNINDLNDLFLKKGSLDIQNYIEEFKGEGKKFNKKQISEELSKNKLGIMNRLNKTDIVKIIENATKPKKIKWKCCGTKLVTKCVFKDHRDLVGSFTVYKDTNSFYCFGCNRGGTPIMFLKYFYSKDK